MDQLKNQHLFHEQCFINGHWVDANNKATMTVVNPFNNRVLGNIPMIGQQETQAAILAAHAALPAWRKLTAKQRADHLWRWAELINQHKEDLARIMTLEQGKPLTESRSEIDYANSFIKWFAEEGRRMYGDIIPSNKPQQHIFVIKQPIGVVAAITPWNFPAAMITRKCAPALAAGCTMVIKPALETPYSAFALAALSIDAGIPPGVINIITGDAKIIGAELTSNPLVRKLSFTGSTAVGKLLMQQSASTVKKLSLELGGNAPFIIFEDADIETAIQGALASKFRNSGQTCVCANRIYVHDSIYTVFTERFIKAVKALKLGNGLDDDVKQGPLISNAAIQKVQRHIQDAVAKGAKVVLGGQTSAVGPLFFEPTVLTDMRDDMLLANEETFGPVAGLFRFQAESEVIERANNTPYGLAAYFYSRDLGRIFRVAEALEYGMVGVNEGIISTEVAPFGGCKESGIGREGSKYGIEDYLEMKYLCVS